MSNPRGFFNNKEANVEPLQTSEKSATDDVMIDKSIARKEFERQLEEAKAMAFGI